MKAGTRLVTVFGAAALMLAAAPARAQQADPPPPADSSSDTSIGPRELQNFSIDGNVTRRAEPPAQRPAANPPRATAAPPQPRTVPAAGRTAIQTPGAAAPDRPAPVASGPAVTGVTLPSPTKITVPRAAPAPSVTVPLPPIDGSLTQSSPAASDFPQADSGSAGGRRGFDAWPWLLAAIALALGGLFLWRSRARQLVAGYADGPRADALVAPETLGPTPRPAPPPPTPPVPRADPPIAPPQPVGIVSTRLRPRLDMVFNPLSCTVDGERVIVEFELELINSGSAPARAVLIEASLFNAGNGQDQVIGAFFANPVGAGERISSIAPLKRFPIRSQVVAPRANVQLFKVDGRELFVPLIAFNALYGWSGGDAQSSSAYLVGREMGGAKLAPFRADLGARQFAGLGARPLPATVRS